MLSNISVKIVYDALKNELLSYKDVTSRMLYNVEVFRCHGVYARIRIKGKSLYIYLKYDIELIDYNYLKVKDVGSSRGFKDTPMEIKVTGKRKLRRCIDLIRQMFSADGIHKRVHNKRIDYVKMYPEMPNTIMINTNIILKNK